MDHTDSDTRVRDILKTLEAPVKDLDTLLELLLPPIDALELVPRGTRLPARSQTSLEAAAVARALPELQHALLVHVVPVWHAALRDEGLDVILEQYFCPVSVPARAYGEGVVLRAISTLLLSPADEWALGMLEKLFRTYSLADLYWAVFHGPLAAASAARRSLAWDDLVRLLPSVPSRVANARGQRTVPRGLQLAPYMSRISGEFFDMTRQLQADSDIAPLTALLLKLVNVGLFPASKSNPIGDTSFFASILPRVENRTDIRETLWPKLLAGLPSIALQKILASLLASMKLPALPLDPSPSSRSLIKRQASVFSVFIGRHDTDQDVVDALISVAVDREWSEGHARIVFTVVRLYSNNNSNLGRLLTRVSTTWTSAQFVRHSLLQRHKYMTLLLLLSLTAFTMKAPEVLELAMSPSFVSAISVYIGHLDASVRRCGLLVAEEVAVQTGRTLKFEGWDGEGEGREWARDIRHLFLEADAYASDVADLPPPVALDTDVGDGDDDKSSPSEPTHNTREADSDDDSLVGYDSDDASSRSPSPTPEEREAVIKDPSLAVAQPRRPRKPVYLLELANMLQETPKPEHESEHADKIEVALEAAEELIRRKEGYGFELEENAVNLVWALIRLQDRYDLSKFDENRQRSLTALVACCPTKAAPATIEQYFNDQFSIQQRFVMLNALAFGARELAGLPVPKTVQPERVAFPSKMLPSAQHARYSAQESETQRIQNLLGDITKAALERARGSNPVPAGIVRERMLRVHPAGKGTTGIVDFTKTESLGHLAGAYPIRTRQPFSSIAAEYFVMPLINRFWVYASDAQTRRSRHVERQASGSAVLLGPLAMAQFLATLGVLIFAARHASSFLAVLAPEALELAIHVGTQLASQGLGGQEKEEDGGASVLTGALELALVVLDASLELDGGRSLGLERTVLVLGVQDWADEVFQGLERGLRVSGGGGALEARLRSAAAGVGVKVSEITDRWRRSMIISDG